MKLPILSAMADISPKRQREYAGRWRQFRDHEDKTARGSVALWEDEQRADIQSILDAALQAQRDAPLRERARRLSLYVECADKTRTWVSPVDFEPDEAAFIVAQAREAWDRAWHVASLGLYSERVLELHHRTYSPFFDALYANLPVPAVYSIRVA